MGCCRLGSLAAKPGRWTHELIIAYKIGIVSGFVVRAAIVRLGFSGVPYDHYERKGREFASLELPRVIRSVAIEWIKWHKRQRDVIVVVSGALDIYLASGAEARGVNASAQPLIIATAY